VKRVDEKGEEAPLYRHWSYHKSNSRSRRRDEIWEQLWGEKGGMGGRRKRIRYK